MPRTGLAFLVGAVAICGLPPLNGFVSELLIYLGMMRAVAGSGDRVWLAGALAAPALAMIGALAVACFVKVFGVVFLGAPRSAHARTAHESGAFMLLPMAALGAGCVLIGGAPLLVTPLLDGAIAAWAPELASGLPPLADLAPLGSVTVAAVALFALIAILVSALSARTRRSVADTVGTWDCGYAAPQVTMQYSASSFAQTIVRMFSWVLRPDAHAPRASGVFAGPASFHSHVPDVVLDRTVRPLASGVGRVFTWLRRMQHGSINAYVLYILVALVVLLSWR
jgi:hydrogenase-4 component B